MKLNKDQIRSLASGLKKKLEPASNHEIWRKCQSCGNWNDLRKGDHCNCGADLSQATESIERLYTNSINYIGRGKHKVRVIG